ncbi:DUF4270 domain-containing protein [Pedobacter sp. SD-b]|uniref:DUF4270 domain-containing protein n=1 Tax=Pedobacter segetis TaxID=2793069 RepID=A0ABS1BH65_9SPHI|nr:DUF4270 domain-containing protein [Pedobacter segetis]MBK0382213.1 DUF4270 domain-containing protein [Pedobacter segetis]
MKFIKTGLLTMLVGLFILGGCKDPSTIGLDIDPNIDINSKLIDTSTVIAKLLKQDSVVANGTNVSVLGYFKDPVFGTTTAGMALAFSLPNGSINFGTSPVLDSAVLVLPFKGFYGDSTNTNYTVEVRQLNENLYAEPTLAYYNNKTWITKSTLLATKNFGAAYKDSLTIQDIVVAGKDTVKRVAPQLRIKINSSFITNNIINLDSATLSSNKAFNALFKGLYLSINKNTTTNNGGLFSFDTYTAGAARLDLFYKNTSSANVVDTVSKSLNITGNVGNAVTALNWDLSGTVVNTELQNTAKNSDILYLKGLTGTQLKVQFPYLNQIKNLGTNIVINKAELVFSVISGTETPYDPLNRLRIYKYDIAERPTFIPDETPFDPRFIAPPFSLGGFYNSAPKEYAINMTGYIQDLISGKTKDYGTFITPNDYIATNSSNYEISKAANVFSNLGRSVVGGVNTPNFKVKLRIYYTEQK